MVSGKFFTILYTLLEYDLYFIPYQTLKFWLLNYIPLKGHEKTQNIGFNLLA